MFGKGTITQTIGAEPMVNLDAAAITQRIGSISPGNVPMSRGPVWSSVSEVSPSPPRWAARRKAIRSAISDKLAGFHLSAADALTAVVDAPDPPERRWIRERIAMDDHDVGGTTRLDHSRIRETEQLATDPRR